MEQNVLPFIQDNIFSTIKVDDLNAIEKRFIVNMAKTILQKEYQPGKKVSNQEEAKSYFQLMYQDLEHEVFSIMCLTNKHTVITTEELFRGTIDGASVYPREVVKHVLQHNASAVMLVHNHPSGDPTPSEPDKRITRRLIKALDMIDVRVLDHIVVAKDGVISFAERGLI